MQRFHFNSRVRISGKSVANYLPELRTLAQYCNFGETLENMLRDRLVVGIIINGASAAPVSGSTTDVEKGYRNSIDSRNRQ